MGDDHPGQAATSPRRDAPGPRARRRLLAVAAVALLGLAVGAPPAGAAPTTMVLSRAVDGPVPGETATLTVASNGGPPVPYLMAPGATQDVTVEGGAPVVLDRPVKEAGWIYEAECQGTNLDVAGALPLAFTAPVDGLSCAARESPERYLVVRKQTDPPGTAETTPFAFSVDATWSGGALSEDFTLLDGQSRAFALPAGAQATVVEDAPGWDASHECTFLDGRELIPRGSGGAVAELDLSTYGADCTFTNAEADTIGLTVTRTVAPPELGIDPVDVTTTPEAGTPIVLPLADGGSASTAIAPYVPTTIDWEPGPGLEHADAVVQCYEGDGFFLAGPPPLTFEGDGQDITCDIFESFPSSVTVTKEVEPEGAGPGVEFPFTLAIDDMLTDFTLEAGETRTFGLPADEDIQVVEGPSTWEATHVCLERTDGPPATVSEGGEAAAFRVGRSRIECTFTNAPPPQVDLTVTRYVVPPERGLEPVDIEVTAAGGPIATLPLVDQQSAVTVVPTLASVTVDWDVPAGLPAGMAQVSCATDDLTFAAGGPPPFTFTTPTTDLHCDVYEFWPDAPGGVRS